MVKSRRTRLAGHVAGMGLTRNAYSGMVMKPEGKKYFANLIVLGRIIMKWKE
jgi:hypothetical protein